ncbi:MAG TPA: sulfotransferase domain-containing protein [Methylocystis sp.]|nr:sulfotransferase domain-containing protein [Methylocystis sp.]
MFADAETAAAADASLSEEPAARAGSNASARKAIWIASYPKSGNTWVRVFLHNLLRELRGEAGAQDINGLHAWTGRESLDVAFTRRLAKPAREASLAEIARARPLAQADLVANAERPVLLKTHNAIANVEGHPTINLGVTLAAVYLLRNPLDVAVSYAHHSGHAVDHVIAFMANPQAMNDRTERHVYEFMGSWSFHVASWMSVIDRPVLILRYEDLLSQPERSFARLARFLRLEPSAAQLGAAIEKSSFARLSRQEEERGFNERPQTAERFFRKGEEGQWKQALTKRQAADVVAAHGPMMMRFGYVAEDCGARV